MATYKIQSGDTLSKIASKNGTTVAALAAANGISDPNKIKAGQTITIPASRTVTAPTTSTKTSSSSSSSKGSSSSYSSSSSKKKVIGQYGGYDIYEGSQSDIQKQMADIDKKTKGSSSTQTKPKTSTQPAPDVGGMYASVIKSNPVLADMLKDPKAKARFDALTPDLQGIFLQTASSLGKAIESGKVVNPNIELTAKENRKLLEQAETELDPYYKEQLGFLKDDFETSVSRLMEDWNSSTSREGEKFKKTLEDNANTEAESGTTYSSGRVDRETKTVNEEQQALDDAALAITRKATDAAKGFEQRAGSEKLRTLNLPQLSTFTASNTGISAGGSRKLYDSLGNVKMGTLEKERTTAVKQRQSELEQAFRAGRILDLSKLR